MEPKPKERIVFDEDSYYGDEGEEMAINDLMERDGLTEDEVREDFTDDEIFNHQIAYEIRLQNAMEEDLICPFHYFGIDYFYRIPNCIHRIFNFRFRYTRNSRRCSRVFTTRKSKFPTEKIYIH